ncbi:MAG: phosphotransferase [Desulfobulbaceae bacterium]|nr:phosphotransferase [Desulfobulbaceae bacterium]
MSEKQIAVMRELLQAAGAGSTWDALVTLSGDGSDRPFFRLWQGDNSYLAVFPSPTVARARDEAHSTYLIGRHLQHSGVPVPAIYAYDQESGGILFEDLGDRLLFHAVSEAGEAVVETLYGQAVVVLADLQLVACAGFRPEWCWDTPRYDRQLMIKRESNYFSAEFCTKFMGLVELPMGLSEEFAKLADRIMLCPADTLMHRDYQSRNLMVVQGQLRVIDFQGARFGPLAYDLVSLLNDPYVSLSEARKQLLIGQYLERLGNYISLDHDRFMEDYWHIALQRNLQVLGAYAFLSQEKGKEFFRPYITPALERLLTLLATTLAADYPVLLGLVSQIAALRREN